MKKSKYTKPYHGTLPCEMTPYEARALCFWAAIGVAKSRAGSYSDAASLRDGDEGIIESWARDLKITLSVPPIFGEHARRMKKKQ